MYPIPAAILINSQQLSSHIFSHTVNQIITGLQLQRYLIYFPQYSFADNFLYQQIAIRPSHDRIAHQHIVYDLSSAFYLYAQLFFNIRPHGIFTRIRTGLADIPIFDISLPRDYLSKNNTRLQVHAEKHTHQYA